MVRNVCLLAFGLALVARPLLAQDLRTYLYDSQGRMTAAARAGPGPSDYVAYAFDTADNRTQRTAYPIAARVSASQMRLGETLLPGQQLISPNGRARLLFQFEGNVVLYANGVARWGTPTATGNALRLVMQGDGNLVLYAPNDVPLWNSATVTTNPVLVMQDDCNLVIYGSVGAVWATGTSC